MIQYLQIKIFKLLIFCIQHIDLLSGISLESIKRKERIDEKIKNAKETLSEYCKQQEVQISQISILF